MSRVTSLVWYWTQGQQHNPGASNKQPFTAACSEIALHRSSHSHLLGGCHNWDCQRRSPLQTTPIAFHGSYSSPVRSRENRPPSLCTASCQREGIRSRCDGHKCSRPERAEKKNKSNQLFFHFPGSHFLSPGRGIQMAIGHQSLC